MPKIGRDADSHALATSLATLKGWREEVAEALADARRWALVHRLTDDQTASRIAHVERRLGSARLSIAFVSEPSRGKRELINALLLADAGTRLPAPTRGAAICPFEISHDPSRPPSMRLLPIDTRESPRALREFIADFEGWEEFALDPARQDSLVQAFDRLSETREVEARHANNLGLSDEERARVRIPCWRYARVNLPHPLLSLGLSIFYVPGLAVLDAEPELSTHRLQEADAVVFVTAWETGLDRADLDLWQRHVQPQADRAHSRFIVLGKIDGLEKPAASATRDPAEIDRRRHVAAEQLGVSESQVFALAARLACAARIAGDGDALERSRLVPFERAVAGGLAQSRREELAATVRAETRTLLAEARTLLESRRAFVEEQVIELGQLQGKNRTLAQSLEKRAADERARIEDMRSALAGLRAVHNRHAAELAKRLDPNFAREAGNRARAAVFSTPFSAGIGEAVDGYFREIRAQMAGAVKVIGEVKALIASVNQKFALSWGLSPIEANPFPTDRFLVEIDRLEEQCSRDFRGASSLLSRGRRTLAALFFDTVVLKTIYVFEIADRDVRAWMSAFIRPLEAQVGAIQEQAQARVEGLARMRDAETGLTERIAELRTYLHESGKRMAERLAHERRLTRLLDAGSRA